ncbi:hypothetical protein [Nocardiopsis composta]|uniref:DUF3558 domain-containing protein n=1 Tax=Nocardiopsis composta TaxID=157465 RepID=A0A7W8QMQ1_9ACTN|nr:hypothetical protein [Nocardiopsis composta]MBB5432645.1 hypothetical protein [Nocardiopsis composta]
MSTRSSGAAAAVAAALVTLAAAGCGGGGAPGGDGGTAPSSGPPAEPSASPEPAWERFGGEALPPPEPEGATPDDADPPEPADPAEVPNRCDDAGISADQDAFTGLIGGDPQFTGVRSANALECSWAGFSTADGSEVVMVSFSAEGSLVKAAGEPPEQAAGDPDFFTTPEVAALGGVAEWRPAEPFSRVLLHFPGLLVTVSANSERMAEAGPEVVEAAAGSAAAVLAPEDGGEEEGGGEPDEDEEQGGDAERPAEADQAGD